MNEVPEIISDTTGNTAVTETPETPSRPEREIVLGEAEISKYARGRGFLFFVRKYAYLLLCFLSYVVLDFGFRYIYRYLSPIRFLFQPALLFTFGWAMILTAVAFILPRVARRIYMILSVLAFIFFALVHAVFVNTGKGLFSFSQIGFSGDGFAFLAPEYLKFRLLFIATLVLSLILMIAAVLLTTRERYSVKKIAVFIAAFAVGVASIVTSRAVILSTETEEETFSWNSAYYDPTSYAHLYQNFTDSNRCMYLTGFYQYTFRDIVKTSGVLDRIANDKYYEEIEEFAANKEIALSRYAGACAGKDLIMIQLEAIDTWMLTKEYMPNTWALRQRSADFTNYYATIFISAGTFNSEFTANTGLIPATGSVSQKVYTENSYAYSLPNLFRDAGYTAESFHGSEGEVYNRGNIHPNLGFEKYNSGTDMKMPYYQLDSQLMGAYDMFVRDDPYYSFIITFSGHGPYNDESKITSDNIDAAREAVAGYAPDDLEGDDLQMYTWAISHAMETDKFIGALVERLEAEGRMDDTVLVVYSDHYNFYMLNDPLLIHMKGVPDVTMLQHVPCFIYDSGIGSKKIDKVVSSLDIMPTVASLFDLDVDLSYFIGNDMLGDGGGHVVFRNYAWYDGQLYFNDRYVGDADAEYIAAMSDLVYRETSFCDAVLRSDYFATHAVKRGEKIS